jgi:hypothetical protein
MVDYDGIFICNYIYLKKNLGEASTYSQDTVFGYASDLKMCFGGSRCTETEDNSP